MIAPRPKVTIIVPSYNCDRFLPDALNSVLRQTYQDYEVIVIDDGSTDRTPQVLQAYCQSMGDRLRVVRQQNQGVAAARNHGIELAQGEWIAFLDADDIFLPGKLAAQMQIAESYGQTEPNLGMIHSGWYRVDAEGKILMAVEPWQQVPQLDLEHWLRWKPVLPSAMLFRRQWLERVGGFDRRFPPAEDTDLVLRLALLGCKTEWLRQITVKYRQHGDSAMHKGLPQANSLTAVIDQFFRQPHLPESIRWQEAHVRYDTLVWIAWYLHYTGHAAEMVNYLQRSWSYSPHPPLETLLHWADSFTAFSQAWGHTLDMDALARSAEWQTLLQWIWQQQDTAAAS